MVALVLGALIYIVVRPGGSSYLSQVLSSPVPALTHLPFANNLPSFFHVFGFSLLTVAALGQRKYTLLSCLAWLVVNVLFEVGQHTFIKQFLAQHLALPELLENYFQRGTFDALDIALSSLGALAAYWVGFGSRSRMVSYEQARE
jgi:hypothetical protein